MGLAEPHALGHRQKFLIHRETASYGEYTKPDSSDVGQTKVLRSSIKKTAERIMREFADPGSNAMSKTAPGLTSVEWSMEQELIPSGTLAVPPDLDRLLHHVYGGKRIRFTITIDDYLAIDAGVDSVTPTVDGVSTPLVEGGLWTAATSDIATATSLVSALNTVSGLSADNVGGTSAVVTVDSTKSVETFTLVTSMDAGTEATLASVHVAYFHDDTDQGQHKSVQLTRHQEDLWELVNGAIVDTFKASGSNKDLPTLEFSGRAKDVIKTGFSTTTAPVAASADVPFQAADVASFDVGGVVQFVDATNGIQNNGGDGYRILSFPSSTTMTIETTVTLDSGAAIKPFTPAPTYLGDAIAGTVGTFSIDGTAFRIRTWEVQLETGFKLQNEHAGETTALDYVEGRRAWTFTLTLEGNRTNIKQLYKYMDDSSTQYDVQIQVGTVGGNRMTFDLDTCEVTDFPHELPDVHDLELTISGIALASDCGAFDECALTID